MNGTADFSFSFHNICLTINALKQNLLLFYKKLGAKKLSQLSGAVSSYSTQLHGEKQLLPILLT